MNLSDAAYLARGLMRGHGLGQWVFEFDRAKTRFGSCNCGKQKITLSEHLTRLNSEDKVREIVLHEIAHALTPGRGHGWEWQRMCIQLGIKPERCYSDRDTVTPKGDYEGKCNCATPHVRFKNPGHAVYRCKRCRVKFVYQRVYRVNV